jgi:hypothetical protein
MGKCPCLQRKNTLKKGTGKRYRKSKKAHIYGGMYI